MERYTPDSYNDAVQEAWEDYPGEGTVRVRPRTPEELATRRIGDAERIALQLLRRQREHGMDTALGEWIDQLIANSACAGRALMDSDAITARYEKSETQDENVFPNDHARHHYYRYCEDEALAAYWLAYNLVQHRLYHEPDSEHTTGIGFGLAVTTSLAAAVAEYHARMIHAQGSLYASAEAKAVK